MGDRKKRARERGKERKQVSKRGRVTGTEPAEEEEEAGGGGRQGGIGMADRASGGREREILNL